MNIDSEEEEEGEEGQVPKRQKFISYDREWAHKAIQEDYLCDTPRFKAPQFQRMFHVFYAVYNCLKEELSKEKFYDVKDYNCAHTRSISIDANILIALKHLGHGCSTNAWIDYFQMAESTSRLCVEVVDL